MSKPLKKALPKKPAKKEPIPSARDRGALPSKGTCKHRGPCFRVSLYRDRPGDLDGADTFHLMDEAGAVMFAMRESRNRGLHADVFGPDRLMIVTFQPRTYDVHAARHALLDYNEWQSLHKEVWDDVHKARRERDPSLHGAPIGTTAVLAPKKKPGTKTLAKKKALPKKVKR